MRYIQVCQISNRYLTTFLPLTFLFKIGPTLKHHILYQPCVMLLINCVAVFVRGVRSVSLSVFSLPNHLHMRNSTLPAMAGGQCPAISSVRSPSAPLLSQSFPLCGFPPLLSSRSHFSGALSLSPLSSFRYTFLNGSCGRGCHVAERGGASASPL